MPARPFDACIQHVRQADKYQTVLFEDVRYSVPRHVAFEPVTVKAYLEQIVLVHKGQVVARHRRSRTAGEQVLEPIHFLAVLERKPAYLDKTKLFKELKLPAVSGMPFKSYRATAKSELALLFTLAEPAATSFKLLKSEGLFSRARVKFKSVLAIAPPDPPTGPVEKSVYR